MDNSHKSFSKHLKDVSRQEDLPPQPAPEPRLNPDLKLKPKPSPNRESKPIPPDPPGLIQRIVALFILLATLGCAGWAIFILKDYMAGVIALVGGTFLGIRLGGFAEK